jgi:nucleotide-binding universal stress UspA family protein
MEPKTFVVPLDGSQYSERALPVAAALAERIGGGLLLVTAESFGPVGAGMYLDQVAERGFSCPVETVAYPDRVPIRAILGAGNAAENRVVCMTTHGRGRIAWTVLGTIAEHIIRRSPRPLILVGPHCRPDTIVSSAEFLVASDGDEHADELAANAATWSEMLGLNRRVAVVLHPLDIESAQHSARPAVPVAAEYGIDSDALILRRDEYPAGALVNIAEDLPAALIAMGCHGRYGMQRVALGSVTMSVVQHAPCPVLAVQPGERA